MEILVVFFESLFTLMGYIVAGIVWLLIWLISALFKWSTRPDDPTEDEGGIRPDGSAEDDEAT